jgi:precorrin-2 dehydrogenase
VNGPPPPSPVEGDKAPGPAGDPPPQGYPDYPVVVSVVGRRCLVVGAGPIGARKARGLVECGAEVTVVAGEVSEAMVALAAESPSGRMRIERRQYRVPEAVGYEFVVPATGDEVVDRRVTTDALAGGALVNRTSVDDIRAVHLPAVHRQGLVTVAVSTGGRSPALARWLRNRIADLPGPDLAVLAELLAGVRSMRRGEGLDPVEVDWFHLIDQIVPLVEAGRIDEARAALERLGQLGRR